NHRSLYDLCCAADARGWTEDECLTDCRTSAARVPAQLPRARRNPGRSPGPHHLGAQQLLRVPEIREIVGAAADRASFPSNPLPATSNQQPATSNQPPRCSPFTLTPHAPGAAVRTRCCSRSTDCGRLDTARRSSRTLTASCGGARHP